MLSLCVVIIDSLKDYLNVMLESILKHKCNLISEIIICNTSINEDRILEKYRLGNKIVKVVGCILPEHHNLRWRNDVCGHALGVHSCIKYSTNNYLLIQDPDTVIFDKIDEIYFDLTTQQKLSIIGASHYLPGEQGYGFFPTIISCLVNKNELPGENWLKGELYAQTCMNMFKEKCNNLIRLDGKYLMPGPLVKHYNSFPNPKGWFDAGCNLYLWFKNKRWLSFQQNPNLNYYLNNYQTNFGLSENFERKPFLFHLMKGARGQNINFFNRFGRPNVSKRNIIKFL